MKLALKETLQNLFDRLHIKRIVRYLSGFVAFSVFLLIIVDAMIGYYVRENIYYDIAKIPNRPYGLVLGTSKYFANNALNLFYHNRLLAAQRLFIYLDFAGFRTLDSVVRADQVFQAHSFTIISQKFHCERALFIAKFHKIDAICFVADYPQVSSWVRIREFFARLQAVWDILIEKEPHFLGEPEPLPPPLSIPSINSDT